jgi:hypothetical protein
MARRTDAAGVLDDSVLECIAEPWRLTPDLFAEHCELSVPGGTFQPTRLAAYLGSVIARAVVRTGARIIVNVAPRQGKSETISYATPAWFLENFSHERFILATHTASLALDYARRVRNEFARNRRLTVALQEDAQSANQWNTDDGGGLKAVGVGGAVMGFGGQLIVVDDPHKGWVEAQSSAERRKVVDWFEGTLMNRLEPGGSIVVVMQRLHKHDLTGYLTRSSKENWQVIRLPAIARVNDPMGRAVGEPVCPERFGRDEMLAKINAMPRMMSAAMYDQDPDEAIEGRTYSGYGPENVKGEPDTRLDRNRPVFATFDFNVNPGMHAHVGQSDTQADRILIRHEIHAERMKTPACAKAVADRLKADGGGRFGFPKLIVYGDRSGKTENTQTTRSDYTLIGQVLRECGISPVEMHVPDANPPVKSRVAAVNDALCDRAGVRHLLIHPECKRLISDFENVTDDDEGLPDKGDTDLTHAADDVGYAVMRIRPIVRKLKFYGGTVSAAPHS